MMFAVSTMHEKMEQRTGQQQEKRQDTKEMGSVLAQKKEGGNGKKTEQRQPRTPVGLISRRMFVVHLFLRFRKIPAQSTESFILFSSAEFTITDRELKAMAAAAIMGFRKPNAATGMPIEL